MRVYNSFKLFFIMFCFIAVSLQSCAADSVFAGIDIRENDKGGMEVIVKTEGKTKIKTSAAAPDILKISLGSAAVSDNADIVYDNTADINNVFIQKKNASDSLVIIEGRNISKADVYIKNSAADELIPLKKTSLLGVNDKISVFSAAALFILFAAMRNSKNRRKKLRAEELNSALSNMIKRSTPVSAPPLYKTASGLYASAPEDFIINRYMDERMRKAG